MALLRGLFASLTSSIIRLAIFAGVLVALWFLLLRPAFQSAGDAVNKGERAVQGAVHSIEKAASPKRLAHCFKRAGGDVDKMKRCTRLF
jgi:hypothetical protein